MNNDDNVQFGNFSAKARKAGSPASVAGMMPQLEQLLNRTRHAAAPASPSSQRDAQEYVKVARRRSAERRERERIFGTSLDEPAWDILLELFIAGQEERDVSLEAACTAACVPSTTALRWIAHIAEAGLVELGPYRGGQVREGLRLSPLGLARMLEYFRQTSADQDRTSA